MIVSFILLVVTEELPNQEEQELQGNTVLPGGNNQTWKQRYRQEGYFALQCVMTDKFLTAINDRAMNISGRFLVIYRSFFGSFWSYLI